MYHYLDILISPAVDTALALLALKTLGRNPTASRVIVSPSVCIHLLLLLAEFDLLRKNLQILLNLATDSRESYADAAYEAMRCVANALLLIEAGRDTWLDIQGGEASVEMLEVGLPCSIVTFRTNTITQRSSSPQPVFLASRILFLITVKQTPFTRKLVEDLRIVDILSQRLDSLMNSLLSGQAMAKEAMVDILKFTFNLLLQYPRMVDAETNKDRDDVPQAGTMGELWSDNLEKCVFEFFVLYLAAYMRTSLLPPLLRVFNGLPPTFPCPLAHPLTHVIHALINIPVAPLASRWFSPDSSPTSTPRPQTSDKFHKALSALAPGRRSISSSRPSSPAFTASKEPVVRRDTVQRAWDLLDITTAHYVPGDPDDAAVRQLCKNEGIILDDTLTPLVVLLTRLAAGDESAKLRMKEWILPANLYVFFQVISAEMPD